MRPDFVNAVQEFFRTGVLLKQLNHAIIALVPKCAHINRVEDYMPISCCKIIYKTISKILVIRITSFMSFFIDPAQAGFLKGRSMKENIFFVQELIREYGKKRTAPNPCLKLISGMLLTPSAGLFSKTCCSDLVSLPSSLDGLWSV